MLPNPGFQIDQHTALVVTDPETTKSRPYADHARRVTLKTPSFL